MDLCSHCWISIFDFYEFISVCWAIQDFAGDDILRYNIRGESGIINV